MLATKMLDYAAEPQQIANEAKSVSSLAQKNTSGSDFKDILAPKLEKAESTSDSLAASVSASIEESVDNRNSDKLKPGEAAEMVKALLKVLKSLRDKKAAAGEVLSAGDRTNLLNLFKRLEEFIKKGLKQGLSGEKDNFKRLKELRQEIFSIITAGSDNGSANGTAQAAAGAAKKSEKIGVSLPSAGDDGQKKEKPLHLTLVDLRKDRAAGKSAALTPASNSMPGKETALSEAVPGISEASEGSRQSMPADQILVRTFSFETGESKGGVEGATNLSETFRRLFIPEIVRQSGIILKDGGKGEIRLILKPESLGRVRIRINIQDNSIEGKILVENNTVRELFEGNMEHLKNALRSEGFDSAALEVAVGGEKSGRDPEKDLVKEGFSSMSKEGALDEFERSMPLLADFYKENLLIDLVV